MPFTSCSTKLLKLRWTQPTGSRNVPRGLGGSAEGTVQAASTKSYLVPYEFGVADEAKHIFAVSAALAAFGQSIREAAGLSATQGDATTEDLFTEISRGIDQQLWFVESHRAPA